MVGGVAVVAEVGVVSKAAEEAGVAGVTTATAPSAPRTAAERAVKVLTPRALAAATGAAVVVAATGATITWELASPRVLRRHQRVSALVCSLKEERDG